MKKTVITLCEHVFGVCLMVSVLVGALVAVLLVIAFAAGGGVGQSLAVLGKAVMYKAIGIAAIGSIVGMLAFYVGDSHVLKIDSQEGASEETAALETDQAVK